MDVITALKTRRSVRKFTTDMLTDSQIETIIHAGQIAPSSRNTQARFFAVFKGYQAIETLLKNTREATARLPKSRYTETLLNPAYSLTYGTPVFIMVFGNPLETHCPDMDCACSLQNMLLAAHGMGIASCWINQLCFVHEDKSFRDYMTSLGIPTDYACYCSAAFGRYDGTYPAAPRLRSDTCVVIER